MKTPRQTAGNGPPFNAEGLGSGEVATMHSHPAWGECTPSCPAFNPDGWRCSMCHRQRPMMANTEDWAEPLCDECFLLTEVP